MNIGREVLKHILKHNKSFKLKLFINTLRITPTSKFLLKAPNLLLPTLLTRSRNTASSQTMSRFATVAQATMEPPLAPRHLLMTTESEALLKAARAPMWYIVRKPHPAKDKSRTFLRDIVNNIFSGGIENYKSSIRESLSHDER